MRLSTEQLISLVAAALKAAKDAAEEAAIYVALEAKRAVAVEAAKDVEAVEILQI